MSRDILNTLLLGGMFLALFAVGELLYHTFRVKAELTRKFIHCGTGLLTLLFPIMLGNHWLVLLLCSTFAVILIVSLRFNLLQSINAIERKSMGSIAYPISVYCCYLAFDYFGQQYLFFYLPVLILAICDPIAALIGKTWPIGSYRIRSERKSMMGSGMFFLSAFLLSIGLSVALHHGFSTGLLIVHSLAVAAVSAFTEGISTKGSDNLTIPASVLLVMISTHFLLQPSYGH